MEHSFVGRWISDGELAALYPRNVFSRQLERVTLDCSEHRDRHILYRRKFSLKKAPDRATAYISADDYYKLYINGRFVAQGPAPSYHFRYNYNVIDVSEYLVEGENLIAVHTLYQGLVNRVWQSGDQRHGLLFDLTVDGETVLSSDESFLVARHSGYTECGTVGYDTQFLERYDSRAREVGFERCDFDDSYWTAAVACRNDDHTVVAQKSHMLVFENISPVSVTVRDRRVLYDFGSNFVGYLAVTAKGRAGDTVTIRCGQELLENGELRHSMRANCNYEEEWVLSGEEDTLDWFDYKSHRYAELTLPEGVEVLDVHFVARHYPFTLRAKLSEAYADDERLVRIWKLCTHTLEYGVQEVIQDCMDREKGFYIGDGCYTALTQMLLTGDDTMVRKLIDDAFSTSCITDTLLTVLDCSLMQEIAEYPLIMIILLLWHYRLTGDASYLAQNYRSARALMEAYRRDYEHDGLLCHLDRWCVVEWPKNFQDNYDVDVTEGKVCEEPHVAINAYYIYAVRVMNEIARVIGETPYRDDESALHRAFLAAFYDEASGLFTDGLHTDHKSLIGNAYAYAFGLCPDERSCESVRRLIDARGISAVSMFGTFPILMRYAKDGDTERIRRALLDDGAWLRMLREDATTTFEGWGRDTKWNTSLFHLTMSYTATFMMDIDHKALFL